MSIWLARALGPVSFGVYNFTLAIVTIFTAISYSGLQGVAVKVFVEDKQNAAENLGTIFYIKLIAGVLSLIVMCITLFLLEVSELKFTLSLLVGIKLLFSSFNTMDLYFESIVLSKYKVIGRNIAYLIRLLLTILFILSDEGLLLLGVILVMEEVIGVLLVGYFFKKKTRVQIKNCKFNFEKGKIFWSQAWPLIFASLGAILYYKIDQIMIVNMVSDAEGGFYAAAVRLTELFYFIPTLLITSLFPILIKIKGEDEQNYNFRLKQLIFILISSSILISLVVYFFADEIINFTFGKDYYTAIEIIKVYIWSLVFVFLGQVLSRWLIMERLTRFSLIRHFLGLGTNIILNFLFIPRWGGEGAATASLISLFMANIGFLVLNKKTLSFLKILLSSAIPLKLPKV